MLMHRYNNLNLQTFRDILLSSRQFVPRTPNRRFVPRTPNRIELKNILQIDYKTRIIRELYYVVEFYNTIRQTKELGVLP